MRMLPALAALFLISLGCGADARAEEEAPFKRPAFTVEQVAAPAEEHPEGWKEQTGEDGAGPVDVSVLREIATAAKIDVKAVSVKARALCKEDGTTGLVAWVGIDADARAFTTALAAAVLERGWVVRELASPHRVVVASGSTKEAAAELLNWACDLAVRKLCKLAYGHLDAAGRQQSDVEYAKAILIAKAAGSIAPDSGVFNAIQGMLAPPKRASDALPFWRKAIDEKAPIPAPIEWRVLAAANLGLGLLQEGTKEALPEALKALEYAAKHGDKSPDTLTRFGAEYNLACAYARLGKKDEAFHWLEASLGTAKEGLGAQYPQRYTHAKLLDSDMDPLRKDQRFDALMEKYAPSR